MVRADAGQTLSSLSSPVAVRSSLPAWPCGARSRLEADVVAGGNLVDARDCVLARLRILGERRQRRRLSDNGTRPIGWGRSRGLGIFAE